MGSSILWLLNNESLATNRLSDCVAGLMVNIKNNRRFCMV